LAHNYFGVDAEEVWQIINNSLLKLETQLKELIEPPIANLATEL